MSKTEEKAYNAGLKIFPNSRVLKINENEYTTEISVFMKGYEEGRKDTIEETLTWLKQYLYSKNYIGVIDLCDEYIKELMLNKNI